MESKALGKGLSALIPDKKSSDKDHNVVVLETACIENNQFQPRTHYDDEKLDELKASIREKGVLQPILVRPKGDGYEVVAGERRLRAARDLNIDEIPAMIKAVTDEEALVLALIENIQREELNPIEEAKAYKRLMDDFHLTHEEIAHSVGKDRSTITNLLRLLKLPIEIQRAVSGNAIAVGHARCLLGVESLNEQKRVFDLTIKKGFSVRELENLVKVKNQGGARRTKQPTKNHEVVLLEEDLQRSLGTKVRLLPQKKRGKIVIEYYSLDDLDRIIKIIKQ